MTQSLSAFEARKLVLHAQRLPPKQQKGSAIMATLSAIEHLGYIQIDTISVVQRAHHHTLWNRNPRYQAKHLDTLLEDKAIFEYWSHAAAYLPMRDYRFSLLRKHAVTQGHQNHWYERNHGMMDAILKRIETEGPLMAKDFEGESQQSAGWGSKPAKRALENLYMQGDLMIPKRVNFHKVYDLTERVIPDGIDTSMPTDDEYARHLITRYLTANGLGLVAEMVYLLKNTKPMVLLTIQQMIADGDVIEIKVAGVSYYALPGVLALLSKPLAKSRLKILSPFDNLLIQRKRMQALFNFDYLIECYVPEAKRRFGYFCLPIMWDGTLVARMDCKAEKKTGTLQIFNLVVEDHITQLDEFVAALKLELTQFMTFNGCTQWHVHKTTPSHIDLSDDS
ncbi:crosslink repair DNA glycosylase YcaQ family protein [Vibrio tapetis subsp. quintayensis]|uniref:winged helix-turn-helix domain-containing protein n=1 Tax=Vibrio tapetis TaxID=52443 RepID=UPI0025B57C9F|nr:crosslink repair DNA glycosylase YcaQ family protein [Vibrio tapetis]MDN3680994.1 crosslink repair DNA glycosylase YcaQ family protein [Vibrio tapetis subsp. quintayensis]